MLHRIIGRTGSGKTEYVKTLLEEKASSGAQCVVIVPVQQSMEYEKDVFTRLGDKANLCVEVLTFDRLPNRTYREYGGLAAKCADEAGRALMMATALEKCEGRLSEFKAVCRDNAFVQKMLDTSRVLKENGVDHRLFAAEEDGRLGDKLRETDIILTEFDSMFGSSLVDTRDALTAYAENLRVMPFFKGKTVLVDSFNSFTEQQQRVLDAVYEQCDDLYVSLCLDDCCDDTFTNPSIAYKRLGRHKECRDTVMPSGMRFRSPCLKYAEENLWNDTALPFDGKSDVEFIKCASVFEQAEAAAYSVISLAKSGMRWRDIVIIARSPESYAGILDIVLRKHGVPCFFSAKEAASSKPLSLFLISAVEAVATSFSLSSVTKLIKSGYAPVTSAEAELITRYARTWNINGKRWISDTDWLMDPKGFSGGGSALSGYQLEIINGARWKISALLKDLDEKLRAARTCADGAKALYSLLRSAGCAEKVRSNARRLRETGDDDGAQRLTQLWDIIIEALEQLHDYGGELPVTPAQLCKKLQLVLGSYTLGAVPAVCDSVVIGGASVFRAGNPRAVILFGVNDGEFPASPSVNGVFDRDELDKLAEKGVYLEDTFEKQIANEKLFFYLASCSASEKVICIYSGGSADRPSLGAARLKKLFPGSAETVFGAEDATRVFSRASACERSSAADGEGRALLAASGLGDALAAREHPLSDPRAEIEYESGGTVYASASRLERYSMCPFSYFASYVLKLSKKAEAEFNAVETGNFVHKLLQLFVDDLRSGRVKLPLEESAVGPLVDSYADEYVLGVTHGVDELPKTLGYTVKRLKKAMRMLFVNVAAELCNSDFEPRFLEERLNGRFVSEDGVNVEFTGLADRIDVCEKDGVKYARIIDYKTGNKRFSKGTLDYGLNAQLLLYMDVFLKQRADEGYAPAGVDYFPVMPSVPSKELCGDADKEKVEIDKGFRRSGLYVADRAVTDSIENGGAGRFINAVITASGEYNKRASVVERREFDALCKKVEDCLVKTAGLIAKGRMNVSPYNGKSAPLNADGSCPPRSDACKYCDYKSVCRLSNDFSMRRTRPVTGEVKHDG